MNSLKIQTIDPLELEVILYTKKMINSIMSAACAYKYFAKFGHINAKGKQIKYISLNEDEYPDITDMNVLVCGLCLTTDNLLKLTKHANKYIVIENVHVGSRHISKLPRNNVISDTNHCGAYLAWLYFNSDSLVEPKVINFIQDYESNDHDYIHTKYVLAHLKTLPDSLEEFAQCLDDAKINEIINARCKAVVDENQTYVTYMICSGIPRIEQIDDQYYKTFYVYSGKLQPEISTQVLSQYKDIDISVVYHYDRAKDITMFKMYSAKYVLSSEQICITKEKSLHECSVVKNGFVNYLTENVRPVLSISNVDKALEIAYTSEIVIGKNVYNVLYVNSHIENDDLISYLMQVKQCYCVAAYHFVNGMFKFSVCANKTHVNQQLHEYLSKTSTSITDSGIYKLERKSNTL